MFNTKLEDAVQMLVQVALPVGTEHSLYVRLCLRLTNYINSEESLDARRYAHFIFNRKSSYVKVFYAEGEWDMPDASKFEMTCDHDTCWRSDGMRKLVNLYFKMSDEIKGHRPPKDMDDWSRIDGVKNVTITMERDLSDKYSYKRLLTKIEVIDENI